MYTPRIGSIPHKLVLNRRFDSNYHYDRARLYHLPTAYNETDTSPCPSHGNRGTVRGGS
jgi:hypothetical protein